MIAPEIPAAVLRLVNKINYEVDLLEVQRFAAEGHEFILVNKREPEVPSKRRATRGTPEYDKDFYRQHRNNRSVDMLFEVAERVDQLVAKKGWALEKKFTKCYIGHKHGFFNVFGLTWLRSKSFA